MFSSSASKISLKNGASTPTFRLSNGDLLTNAIGRIGEAKVVSTRVFGSAFREIHASRNKAAGKFNVC